MTTRELLRDIADRLHADKPHPCCDVLCAEDATRAAALRAIADRFDAEMEYAKPGGQTYGMLKFHKEGALACLARLDAPVLRDGRPTTGARPMPATGQRYRSGRDYLGPEFTIESYVSDIDWSVRWQATGLSRSGGYSFDAYLKEQLATLVSPAPGEPRETPAQAPQSDAWCDGSGYVDGDMRPSRGAPDDSYRCPGAANQRIAELTGALEELRKFARAAGEKAKGQWGLDMLHVALVADAALALPSMGGGANVFVTGEHPTCPSCESLVLPDGKCVNGCAPTEARRCEAWCGTGPDKHTNREHAFGVAGFTDGDLCYCTPACRDAGRPLNPKDRP